MDSEDFPGCCAMGIVYYLGGAESVPRLDKRPFAITLKDHTRSRVMIASTVKIQDVERGWLEEFGFSTVKCKHMFIHYGESTEIRKKINEFLEEQKKPKEPKKPEKPKFLEPPFSDLIKRSEIDAILNKNNPVEGLNTFYKLFLPGFIIQEEDLIEVQRTRVLRQERLLELRRLIFRLVQEHRTVYNEVNQKI